MINNARDDANHIIHLIVNLIMVSTLIAVNFETISFMCGLTLIADLKLIGQPYCLTSILSTSELYLC